MGETCREERPRLRRFMGGFLEEVPGSIALDQSRRFLFRSHDIGLDRQVNCRNCALDEPRSQACMSTFHGCGISYYGWRHADDGTAVATKWITVLWLPVFPLHRERIRVL